MSTEIKAPTLPESVPDGTIATWHKNVGDPVSRDELLVDIETDKVVIEVVSPADGTLAEILKATGDTIVSNEVIGNIGAAVANTDSGSGAEASPGLAAAAGTSASAMDRESQTPSDTPSANSAAGAVSPLAGAISPAAKKLIAENNLEAAALTGTGKNGLITKEDVLNYLASGQPAASAAGASAMAKSASANTDASPAFKSAAADNDAAPTFTSTTDSGAAGRREERVPMSRLRATVAERLLQATRNTAMLTTFNEVNMQPIMAIRNRHKEEFEKVHQGVRLGFMSFFVRACIEALKRFPAVNASIDGSDIVYHGYQDIGVAVSSPRGLVVPVLRDADHKGLAQIEKEIRAFGEKARDGKLAIEEMTGGTFTLSNGGVFGSLLSTPILNPPQTAILGMHKIQQRPMAVDGEVKVLPMMYLALSYDHRLIDGREAVQFLVTVKELLEDPTRLLLEI
ncbi:MAG: 2-oxoglutarate dehydrogenase complex dihydrolipoyllysine-residue succinyltransferase [Pseudohongiellaceae bacterium]